MATPRKTSTVAERGARAARGTSRRGTRAGRPNGTKTIRGKTWQERFLDAFREQWTITKACEAIGVTRKTVYNERQRNEDFALAFAEVDEQITERLEHELIRRAIEGCSDRLLEFALKARRPDKYSDQHRMIHSGEIAAHVAMEPEKVREELAAFGLPAAIAVDGGPEAVVAPEEDEA